MITTGHHTLWKMIQENMVDTTAVAGDFPNQKSRYTYLLCGSKINWTIYGHQNNWTPTPFSFHWEVGSDVLPTQEVSTHQVRQDLHQDRESPFNGTVGVGGRLVGRQQQKSTVDTNTKYETTYLHKHVPLVTHTCMSSVAPSCRSTRPLRRRHF